MKIQLERFHIRVCLNKWVHVHFLHLVLRRVSIEDFNESQRTL